MTTLVSTPASPPDFFQGGADESVGQQWQLSIRNRNETAVPCFETHGRSLGLDVDDAVPFTDFNRATASQTVAQRFRDDDAAGRIDGGPHGRRIPSVSGRPATT